MSAYTVMVVQTRGDDVKCEAVKASNGKWAGQINLYNGEFFHTHLLTEDEPTHETEEAAFNRMKEIHKQMLDYDFTK